MSASIHSNVKHKTYIVKTHIKNMVWKTYLVLYFGTTGTISALDAVKRIEALGFNSSFGPVDFVHIWGEKKPSKEAVLSLANQVAKALKGSGAVFNLDTHN